MFRTNKGLSPKAENEAENTKWKAIFAVVFVLTITFIYMSWSHITFNTSPQDPELHKFPSPGHPSNTFAEKECSMMCPMVYSPVCGSDGVTYSNKCRMSVSACVSGKVITVAHEGKCSDADRIIRGGVPPNRLADNSEDRGSGSREAEIMHRGGSLRRNLM